MLLTRALLRRAVKALCEVARIKEVLAPKDAPVEKEATQEWQDAKAVDALLREKTPPEISDEE